MMSRMRLLLAQILAHEPDLEAATVIGKDAFARVFESLRFDQTFGKRLEALG